MRVFCNILYRMYSNNAYYNPPPPTRLQERAWRALTRVILVINTSGSHPTKKITKWSLSYLSIISIRKATRCQWQPTQSSCASWFSKLVSPKISSLKMAVIEKDCWFSPRSFIIIMHNILTVQRKTSCRWLNVGEMVQIAIKSIILAW